ncbi:hypothetical protein C4546_04405 [Candidatus Parcubacteria bacterium]|nr:MAG: hypothetical protein C4546_04405 [Candidatus Parcubacteria bacterium]
MIKKYLTTQNLTAGILIAFAVAARFLPHPANFAPVAAVAMFSGVYLGKRASIVVPVLAMMASDIFLGLHNLIFFTWGCMILSGLIGRVVRKKKNVYTIAGGILLGSVIFFLVTNAAVWFFNHGEFYAFNFSGLILAYEYGLPFFRNTVLGDLFYTGVFFGVMELVLAWQKRKVTIRT